MSRRYPGGCSAGTKAGDLGAVLGLRRGRVGVMSRRYPGGCSAGTKAGDLGAVLWVRRGEGRRAMSRRYPGGCSGGTKAGDLGAVLGLRRGRVGVPCHAATREAVAPAQKPATSGRSLGYDGGGSACHVTPLPGRL
ncbi:MAG: hypothetical protein KGZ50_01760 [Peptococcaceae bacterium]|nr:hypothetical protein [Peptococcaceae bacterium]